MRVLKSVLAICASALIFAQCAEKEGEDYSKREQAAFDNWMKVNHDRPGVERQENGMYIEWLREGAGSKLVTDNYMRVDYRAYDLNGNMLSNRNRETALREGTFTRYAHYIDHFALYNKLAYRFTAGEYDALALMSEGDSVRLYLPASLAYSTSGTYPAYGFEGWYNSSNNPKNASDGSAQIYGRPIIIDLALKEVIGNAKTREQAEARAAANAIGGFVQDTVGLYFRYVEDPEGDVSGEDTESGVITEDSTFHFVYALRFLDDFLIATNDASTAWMEWEDNWTTYQPTQFSKSTTLYPNTTTGKYISAINKLIKRGAIKIRYNSRMQILFTSEYAYGDYGNAATSTRPEIYPYTPLKMDIITLKYGYGEEEEEETEEDNEG